LEIEGKITVRKRPKAPVFDECIFGLGKCPVKRYLARLKQEQGVLAKAEPILAETFGGLPPEMQESLKTFANIMSSIMSRTMETYGEAAQLAAFCQACVWVKALKAVDWFEKQE